MERNMIVEISLDSTKIFGSVMAEYALISAGKSEENEIPMQYARCDLEKIYKVVFMEETGRLCSSLAGYIDNCTATSDSTIGIIMRVPAGMPAVTLATMRKRMESWMVATVLWRFLLPVSSAQAECAGLAKRSRAAMRSLRQMLAPR